MLTAPALIMERWARSCCRDLEGIREKATGHTAARHVYFPRVPLFLLGSKCLCCGWVLIGFLSHEEQEQGSTDGEINRYNKFVG